MRSSTSPVPAQVCLHLEPPKPESPLAGRRRQQGRSRRNRPHRLPKPPFAVERAGTVAVPMPSSLPASAPAAAPQAVRPFVCRGITASVSRSATTSVCSTSQKWTEISWRPRVAPTSFMIVLAPSVRCQRPLVHQPSRSRYQSPSPSTSPHREPLSLPSVLDQLPHHA